MKKQDKKEPIATLGLHLRKERELRGIDLDEVSKVTRVRIAYLEHLENDRLADLPGDVYIRGYVRAYARFLGIDEDRCIELSRNQSPVHALAPVTTFDGTFAPSPSRSLGAGLGTGAGRPLPALNEERAEPAATVTSTGGMSMGSTGSGGRSRIGLALVLVVLFFAAILITGVYYVNRSSDPGADAKNKPPAAKNDKNADFFLDS